MNDLRIHAAAGVYCRSTCTTHPPTAFFGDAELARRAGLRPCPTCRPDDALMTRGFEVWPQLLTHAQCDAVTALYDDASRFRSKVVMARHNFGRGEYQYFGYPLPELISTLRSELYQRLAPIAQKWTGAPFPMTHAEFVRGCHDAGQTRPTPLLLRYGEGDFNCLHQDLYGERVFPLQVAILLSQPGRDFTGGEFVLTEQRPRMQSRVHVVPLSKGDAVAFAVNHVPRRGARGTWRASLRHGVSIVRSGARHTLGLLFRDAP